VTRLAARPLVPLLLLAAFAPLLPLLAAGPGEGWEALRNSLVTAAAAVLVATPIGTAAGIGLRGRFPGRAAALALVALPWLLPPVLPGAALLLVAEATGIGAGRPGAALWHALLAAPLVAGIVADSLGRVEPALFRAAAAAGAPPDLAARRLLRPRLMPAMAAGAAIAFALSIGEGSVALLLGAGTLPVATLPGGVAAGSVLGPALVALVLAAAFWRPLRRS